MDDLISRQAAIDEANAWLLDCLHIQKQNRSCGLIRRLEDLPSAQPEIIQCRDCVYGEQDDIGRWVCRSLGCQVGNEDGSGFCADAERRTDE